MMQCGCTVQYHTTIADLRSIRLWEQHKHTKVTPGRYRCRMRVPPFSALAGTQPLPGIALCCAVQIQIINSHVWGAFHEDPPVQLCFREWVIYSSCALCAHVLKSCSRGVHSLQTPGAPNLRTVLPYSFCPQVLKRLNQPFSSFSVTSTWNAGHSNLVLVLVHLRFYWCWNNW